MAKKEIPISPEVSDVQKWHNRIQESEKLRDKMSGRYDWPGNIEKYRGYYKELADLDINAPSMNLVFGYVQTELPRLYVRDPYIKVNPKKEATIQASKILEMALNYIWRTKRIKNENKKNIKDTILTGQSWFKTGYTGEFGVIEDYEGNPMEGIIKEDFFGYRIPNQHVYFDVDAVNPPFDCRWIAHEYWVPLEKLKGDKKYNQEAVRMITGSPKKSVNNDSNSWQAKDAKSDIIMARLFEIWDKENQEFLVIAEGCSKFLKKPKEWPYDMKGFPFSYLKFNEVNDEPYGLPDAYILMPQWLEKIKIRAQQLDHLKRYNRQIVQPPNNMTEEEEAKMEKGITGASIKATNPDAIKPIPYPPLPQDAYAVENRLDSDIIYIGGQNPLEAGAQGRAQTRTKTELIEQQEGSETRRTDKIDTVEDFIEDIAGNYIALLQQLATVPFYVRITGKDAQEIVEALRMRPSAMNPETAGASVTNEQGFTFTKEDIKGEFDVEVKSGSTVPLNRATKIQIVQEVAKLAPALGIIPGGPVAGALGRIMAEETDMPELTRALDMELEMQQQMKQDQAKQLEEQQQLQAANDASQIQIQAERIATQQQGNMLKTIVALQPKEQNEAPN